MIDILERIAAPPTDGTVGTSHAHDAESAAAEIAPVSKPVSVSIIIPAYNAAATLADTLESLLAQAFREWEAIVVDDGSADDTAAVVAGFAQRDARIRSVSGPHQGVSAARNAAITIGSMPCVSCLFAALASIRA